MRYSRLERPLNRKSASGNKTSLHDLVFYGTPTPRPTYEALRGITRNLTIKTPKYVYQREYQIIGSQPVEWRLKPDENNHGRKIEEYGNAKPDPSKPLGVINTIIKSINNRYKLGETVVRRRIEI